MTLITADPPAPRPPRPATVTVAFWLQLAAVLLLLVLLGLMVGHAIYFDGLISRAVELVPDADPSEVSGERTGNVLTTVVPGAIILVVVAWLAATAWPLLRGRNVARILVFIAGGAHLLVCAAPFVAGAALIPLFIATGPEYGPEYDSGYTPEGVPLDDIVWEDSRFFDTLYGSATATEDVLYARAGAGHRNRDDHPCRRRGAPRRAPGQPLVRAAGGAGVAAHARPGRAVRRLLRRAAVRDLPGSVRACATTSGTSAGRAGAMMYA
jgi:hypothetical protein